MEIMYYRMIFLWLDVNSIVTLLLCTMIVLTAYYTIMLTASVHVSGSRIMINSDVVIPGQFGVVYRGHLADWKGTKPTELVAVKTLKEGKHYIHVSMYIAST